MVNLGSIQVRLLFLLHNLNGYDLEIKATFLIFPKAASWGIEWYLEALASELLYDLEVIGEDIECLNWFFIWGKFNSLIDRDKNRIFQGFILFDRNLNRLWDLLDNGSL